MEAAAIAPAEAQSLPLAQRGASLVSIRHSTSSRVPTTSVVAGIAHGGHDPDRGSKHVHVAGITPPPHPLTC